MQKGWKDAKKAAYMRQGGHCQICRDSFMQREMVGHHISNRCQSGTDTLENCRMRCVRCETWAHKCHKYGNPNPDQVANYRYRMNAPRRIPYISHR